MGGAQRIIRSVHIDSALGNGITIGRQFELGGDNNGRN